MSKKRADPASIAAQALRPDHEVRVFISGEMRPGLQRQAARQKFETGGAYRDRTDDPLLAKQVLSQLS